MPGSLKGLNTSTKIIEKYKSQSNLSVFFDQDEAQNNYSLLDYFGFYHPDGLTHRDKEVEHKYRKKDVKRVDKWMKFIQSKGFKSFYDGHPNEELVRRVFKGIPPPIRPRIWPILLNVAKVMRDRVYEDMRKCAFISSTYIEQIDLDINRTFRSSTFFNESFGPRQQALFRILSAYSMYNTEVGYCQGMSDIAGMLLIYIMDEEEAFWALVQLLDGSMHKMHYLFVPGFPGLKRYFDHHEHLLRTHLHKVWKHFRQQHIDCCTYAFKWYMQCFLGRLPISLTLRIWDIYLLEGEKALVAMAYNILKMHKKHLLQMDQMQVLTFLQDEIARDFGYDDDDVIDSLKDCLEELRSNSMDIPPPIPANMLPTKATEQVPAVWEVRHSEDEDNAQAHQQSRKSNTKQISSTVCSETDGVVRSDGIPTRDTTNATLPVVSASAMRKPPSKDIVTSISSNHRHQSSSLNSQESPLPRESRRRLKGSRQSINSSNSVFISHISSDNVSSANHHRHHHSLPKPNSSRNKNHIETPPTTHNSIPQSRQFYNNDTLPIKKAGNGKEESGEEKVWFVLSGTGGSSRSEVRIKEDKEYHGRQKIVNDDLPPRDYKVSNEPGTVTSHDDAANSPWMSARPPTTPLKRKVKDTANKTSTTLIEWSSPSKHSPLVESSPLWTKKIANSSKPLPPEVCEKLGSADTYGMRLRRPGNSYALLGHTTESVKNSGDTRWSVHGTISVLSSPPRACSPIYYPPSQRRD